MRLGSASFLTENSYLHRMSRAALLLGGVQGFRLVVLLVRNKVLAHVLGPSGLGILSQLNSVADTASLLCTAGLGVAIARFAAADESFHRATDTGAGSPEAEAEPVEGPAVAASEVVQVGALMIGIGAVFVTVLMLLFRVRLAEMMTGEARYAGLLALVVLTVPLNAVYQWSSALLLGSGNIRGQAMQSGAQVILWAVAAVILVLCFGLAGGAAGIFVAWAVAAIASVGILRRQGLGRFVTIKFRRPDAAQVALGQRMLKFGGVALVSALAPLLTVLGTRTMLIHWSDAVAAGYYQVPVAMSNLSFSPLTLALSGFVLPHLYRYCRGSQTQWSRLHAELDSTLVFVVGILTSAVTVLLLLRHVLTRALFSVKFMPAAAMIPPQLAADYFHGLAWWLALPLLPLHRYRPALCADISGVVISVGAAALLLPRFGLVGAPLGALVAQVLLFCGLLVLRLRSDGLHLRPRTVAMVCGCSGFIAVLTVWAMGG